ncbi:MAG: hypothetical protein F6K10_35615 [Moorea sp. SIO2B7]|nr:hypothetical protein [Moorena sp. SIO2B7]
MAKRPRYANNKITFNLQPSTLAKRPRYANNKITFNQPTLAKRPRYANNLGQKATLREQPTNFQPNNLQPTLNLNCTP